MAEILRRDRPGGRAVRRWLLLAFAALAITLAHGEAPWPTRPIRLIVTYPAGGGNDIIARMLAQKMSESLGQPVVVENHAGAGGTVGTALAARSPKDGYTLVLVSTPFAMSPSLYPSLPYDTLADLAPVTLICTSPNVLVVHPSLPVANAAELIAYARANPGRVNAATLGGATTQHLAAALFNQLAKTDILLVPYKGSAPGMNDLLGGQVQMMFNAMPSTMPYVKAGRLKALAVTSRERSAQAPDLPPLADALPGYEIVTWWGVLVPAGVPQPIVERLYAEIVRALDKPDVKAKLADMGVNVDARGPGAFAETIRVEIDKWAGVIREANVKAE